VRYRRSDDEAFFWSEIVVPQRFAPDREQARAGEKAVCDFALERHGLKLEHVEQEVSIIMLRRAGRCASRGEPGRGIAREAPICGFIRRDVRDLP
jgi:DNA-binding GntR family transcriptional regulator